MALNVFRLIGDLFTNVLFLPFDLLRLDIARGNFGWWTSNAFNWLFLVVLIFLLTYWVGQALKFRREGTEDRA